jgi:hypothetical protein
MDPEPPPPHIGRLFAIYVEGDFFMAANEIQKNESQKSGRVARLFLVKYTQTGKRYHTTRPQNIPKGHKIY